MAYKLSFGDGDADTAFWERLSGYCVEITSPDGAGADYEVVGGTTWNEELGLATLRVRSWDGDRGRPVGEPFDLAAPSWLSRGMTMFSLVSNGVLADQLYYLTQRVGAYSSSPNRS